MSTRLDRKSLIIICLCVFAVVTLAVISKRPFGPSSHSASYSDNNNMNGKIEEILVENGDHCISSGASRNHTNSQDAAVRRRKKASPFKQKILSPVVAVNFGSSSSKKLSRKFIISYVDGDRGNSVGVMYGALSRLCYAQQYGYHSILYNDRDLAASIFPTKHRRPPQYHTTEYLHRTWSKCFLMEYTFNIFNLTEDDWVFWLDSDTAITNPAITLENIIEEASMRHVPLGEGKFAKVNRSTPELLIANSHVGINNGIFAMRATPWSRKFLHSWWDDKYSNEISADNGPFMHTVLRFMAINNGIKYNNDCHKSANPANSKMGGFEACYKSYMAGTLCKGEPTENCISRVPHDDTQYEVWDARWQRGMDYELGFILENDPKIGGHARINNGFGWSPTAKWTPDRWVLHMAGRGHRERNGTLQQFVKRFVGRFNTRCF